MYTHEPGFVGPFNKIVVYSCSIDGQCHTGSRYTTGHRCAFIITVAFTDFVGSNVFFVQFVPVKFDGVAVLKGDKPAYVVRFNLYADGGRSFIGIIACGVLCFDHQLVVSAGGQDFFRINFLSKGKWFAASPIIAYLYLISCKVRIIDGCPVD